MTRHHRLTITVILSGLCVLAVLLAPPRAPERVVAGMLLVLVLPGYGLAALLPVASGRRHLLIIPALSISAVILLSGAMYVLRIRLDLSSWSLSLAALGVLGHLLSGLRRARFPQPLRVTPRGISHPLLAAGAATLVLLAGAAVVTARSVERQENGDHFTQLWAVPAPRAERLLLGIYNHEGERRLYHLRVYSGTTQVQSEEVAVNPGRTVTVPASRPLRAGALRVSLLYAGRGRETYRWIRLGLSPPGRGSGVFCGPGASVPLPRGQSGAFSCLQPRTPLLR
jgi:hypothetical protein